MYVLTFDVDWAIDPVLEDCISLLERYNARATFFCTHETEVLRCLDLKRYELAVHPNFLTCFGKNGTDYREVFDDILAIFPDSRGFRSHGLVQSGDIHTYAAEVGLQYESNMFHPNQPEPYYDYQGLVRIPICWADGRTAILGQSFDGNHAGFYTDRPIVMNFHPIHVYLNTESISRYKAASQHLNDFEELKKYRNQGPVPGARDFLKSYLEKADDPSKNFYLMSEIADLWKIKDKQLYGQSSSLQIDVS